MNFKFSMYFIILVYFIIFDTTGLNTAKTHSNNEREIDMMFF